MLCIALLTVTFALATNYFQRKFDIVQRKYITPMDATYDLGTYYPSYNDSSGSKDLGKVGKWHTYTESMDFTIDFTNNDTIAVYYDDFKIEIIMIGAGSDLSHNITLSSPTYTFSNVAEGLNGNVNATCYWTVSPDVDDLGEVDLTPRVLWTVVPYEE